MQRYSCRILNRDGSVDSLALGDFPALSEAVRAARGAVLVSLTGSLVELWSDGRLLSRVDREVAQFRRRPVPFPETGWSVGGAAE